MHRRSITLRCSIYYTIYFSLKNVPIVGMAGGWVYFFELAAACSASAAAISLGRGAEMASIVVLGMQPSVTQSVVLSLYDPESSTVHLSEFELVFSPAARLPLGLCGVCDCIPHRGQLPRFPVLRYCSLTRSLLYCVTLAALHLTFT